MTNETAPERIWFNGGLIDIHMYTSLREFAGGTEYVRADAFKAAQARIAELEGVLKRIGSAAQFYSQPGTDGMASRYAHESHARLVHAALETANQDSHGTDQQHESPTAP